VEEVARKVAARLRSDSAELSVVMRERIGERMPELVADPADAEVNRASNEANILLVADLLDAGADPRGLELPVPTLAYAREGAQRDTSIQGLIRAYRIGHTILWEWVLEVLEDEIEDRREFAAAVEELSGWLHDYIDVAIGLGEEVYAHEREEWVRSTAAIRAEAVREVLESDHVDAAAVSRRLGYELARTHVALVAWRGPGDHEAAPPLESVLRGLASATGAGRPLVHAVGHLMAVMWVGLADPDASFAIPSDWSEPGACVAVGDPGAGIEGFRRTFREAMEARRVATLRGAADGSVTTYADVALVSIATADPVQARAFVSKCLGELHADDATSIKLAETVAAFLDEGGSHSRAATRLGIHENTVRYRVRQAEDLMGRPILTSDLDLRVAIAIAGAASGAQAASPNPSVA